MTDREAVVVLAPPGVYLCRASNRGRKVWALVPNRGSHTPGVHRYTLSDGTPVYDWDTTLAGLRLNLARRVER